MNEQQIKQVKELIKALFTYASQEDLKIWYDGDEEQPMFKLYDLHNKLLFRLTIYRTRLEIEYIIKGVTITIDLNVNILNEKEIVNIMYSMN